MPSAEKHCNGCSATKTFNVHTRNQHWQSCNHALRAVQLWHIMQPWPATMHVKRRWGKTWNFDPAQENMQRVLGARKHAAIQHRILVTDAKGGKFAPTASFGAREIFFVTGSWLGHLFWLVKVKFPRCFRDTLLLLRYHLKCSYLDEKFRLFRLVF